MSAAFRKAIELGHQLLCQILMFLEKTKMPEITITDCSINPGAFVNKSKTRLFDKSSIGENGSIVSRVTPSEIMPELPKGSVTFQRVLEEIRLEKEAEQALLQKTVQAFMGVKKKKTSQTNERIIRNSRWKLASMKLLSKPR